MKSNYFLTIDLTSSRKFLNDQIDDIKSNLELNEEFLKFSTLFSSALSVNFNGFIEIYIEDEAFDNDILNEVEELIGNVDSFIPGGWVSDSKIEWVSEIPDQTYIWFKDGDKWSSVMKEHDRGFIGEDEEWDEDSEDSYSPYDDYDEDSW
jgi:hypothetical protein